MQTWCFSDPLATTVLTQRRILAGQPVLFVRHDEEGYWYFFDEPNAAFRACYEPVLAPLERVVTLHPSVQEVAGLPAGWQAWRISAEQPWERESSKTLERTRARAAAVLEKMSREAITLPPGTPSVVEMLREDRER